MSAPEKGSDILQPIAAIDRLIHEPARLMILAVLYVIDSADFLFLLRQTELTRGNLSSHLSRLEQASYVHISKVFENKLPRTLLRLTSKGRDAFDRYRKNMMDILEDLPV